MIYLKNTAEEQMMYIPRLAERCSDNVLLTIQSSMTQQTYEFSLYDGNSSILYHKVMVSLPNLSSGEYTYTLSDAVGELSSGVLVIGDLQNPIEYINETEYEQYEE